MSATKLLTPLDWLATLAFAGAVRWFRYRTKHPLYFASSRPMDRDELAAEMVRLAATRRGN